MSEPWDAEDDEGGDFLDVAVDDDTAAYLEAEAALWGRTVRSKPFMFWKWFWAYDRRILRTTR